MVQFMVGAIHLVFTTMNERDIVSFVREWGTPESIVICRKSVSEQEFKSRTLEL